MVLVGDTSSCSSFLFGRLPEQKAHKLLLLIINLLMRATIIPAPIGSNTVCINKGTETYYCVKEVAPSGLVQEADGELLFCNFGGCDHLKLLGKLNM